MNSRNKFLQQLIEYVPSSKWEQQCVNKIIRFVSQHENYTDREFAFGHVTGSAWLLNYDCTKVLLTHHKKLDKWLQLGGHAEGESHIIDVALREAKEESGIDCIAPLSNIIFDLDIHPFPQKDGFPEHWHFDIRYLLRVTQPADFTISDESHDLRWFGLDEQYKLALEPSVQRMFNKWRKLKPLSKMHPVVPSS